MTGEDHNTDAFIAALRSPAQPAEQVGEAAAVTAMLEALPTVVPARPTGLRSRRGVAIAAVTVASLGVGGLAAAGPGFFQPAADQPEAPPAPSAAAVTTVAGRTDQSAATTTADPGIDEPPAPIVAGAPESPVSDPADGDVECTGDNHGDTVSSIARATEPGPDHGQAVSAAAQSDCGKPDTDDADETDETVDEAVDGDVECTGDNHGDTVSSIARATEPGPDHGQAVSAAAQSDCGKPDTDDADETDDRDDRPVADPGNSGDAPGNSGSAPGNSGSAPGNSGDAPGNSGSAPGNSGDAPGNSGKTRP